jgi:hypothetical protein
VVLEALGCATERLLMELADHIRTLGGFSTGPCLDRVLTLPPVMPSRAR